MLTSIRLSACCLLPAVAEPVRLRQLLLEQLPPERALRTWMGRYADFVATKRGMAGVLLACQEREQREQVERLLDLLMDGLLVW